MKKLKIWIFKHFLPEWCRGDLLRQLAEKEMEIRGLKRQLSDKEAYIEGLHDGMKMAGRLTKRVGRRAADEGVAD